MSQHTAEAVMQQFRQLPTNEKAKFFTLLGYQYSNGENFSREEVFSDVIDADFTAKDAADYLEVSIATFRRYVQAGKICAASEIGRSQLYSTKDLKAFKRALKDVKG